MKLKDVCFLKEKLWQTQTAYYRNIILLIKVHTLKSMVFSAVMYGCDSWTIEKTECWRPDAFELWFSRRLLRDSWAGRRSNSQSWGYQPWILIQRTDVEAEFPILWPPSVKRWLIEKDYDAGKDWGWEEKGAGWTWIWIRSNSWWWTGKQGVLQSMGSQRVGHDWATELNWTGLPDI